MLLWGATVLKKTLPVKYKPNTSPAVLEQFLIQMKGPEELLVNILHKIPSLSPVLPHTQSKTQHVNGEAVQEQILVSQTATTPKNFWNISASFHCFHSQFSRDSHVPFWSTRCCSFWCQCWQEFLEMPQTPLAGVGYDCPSPHTDILGKQETCHCCGHS